MCKDYEKINIVIGNEDGFDTSTSQYNNMILIPLTRRHFIIAAKNPIYSIGSLKRGKLEDGAIIIVQGIVGMNRIRFFASNLTPCLLFEEFFPLQ